MKVNAKSNLPPVVASTHSPVAAVCSTGSTPAACRVNGTRPVSLGSTAVWHCTAVWGATGVVTGSTAVSTAVWGAAKDGVELGATTIYGEN